MRRELEWTTVARRATAGVTTNFIGACQCPYSIFLDQWGVVHGVPASAGRYTYMSDLAAMLQKLDIGWAWWTWRGGHGGEGWQHGSFEIIYDYGNGSIGVDQLALDAVAPYMFQASA